MKIYNLLKFLLICLTMAPQIAFAQNASMSQRADPEIAGKLIKVKRIYIESFGDDKVSNLLHAMLSNSISQSGRFIVTENKQKADAVLKGTALEKTSQELHAVGEGTAVSSSAGALSGSGSSTAKQSSASIGGAFRAIGAAIQDSSVTTETIDRAAVSVRLIADDGDLIWSSTQESRGAKFKGAAADVADKIVKQLLRDVEKIQKLN